MKKILLSMLLLSTLSNIHISSRPTQEQSEKQIKLYVYQGCPYCKKVINYLKKHNWYNQITIVDVNQNDNYKLLQKLSGNTQCPFLHDETRNVTMLESNDIITYFETRFSA